MNICNPATFSEFKAKMSNNERPDFERKAKVSFKNVQVVQDDGTRDLSYHLGLLETINPLHNKVGSDCILILEHNQQIKTHSAILSTVSPQLHSIWLQGNNNCFSCEAVIHLPSVSVSTAMSFLYLLYTGSCICKNLKEKADINSLMQALGVSLSICLVDNSASGSVSRNEVDGVGTVADADGVHGREGDTKVNKEESNDLLEVVTDESNMEVEEIGYSVVGACYEDEEDHIAVASYQTGIKTTVFKQNLEEVPVSFFCDIEKTRKCSKYCTNDCSIAVSSWSSDKMKNVKKMFRSEESSCETKNKLLRHLKSQFNIGAPTDAYRVHGQSFCLKFFSFLTDISEHMVKSVLIDFWKGYSEYSHGNKGKIKNLTVATTSFICWLRQFSETYGQFSPETNTTVLSYWLNKQVLFNMYRDETCGPYLSLSAFYQNFKTHFSFNRADKTLPHVRISKYSSHSICNQCVALNNNRRQAKSEAELQIARDLENQHKVIFGGARRSIQEIKQSSLSFPADNLFIQVNFLRFLKKGGKNANSL